ncbi:Sensory neuron membrane protein 1 [Orchesella cincta]|uniref:Sensory neuron membrane protein 1 n=1 Tax=Orchesella cincta TaxID=48709 RepID=A0A1D2MF84_ORCCI|nr:Sensory neuron membrane protein 1 [Orchesella cincta]
MSNPSKRSNCCSTALKKFSKILICNQSDAYPLTMRHNKTDTKKLHKNIFVAALCFLTAVCLGWVLLPYAISSAITAKGVISPELNAELYSAWIHPPMPVYMKLYLFNVTNADEVTLGALPKFEELGPFVFLKNMTKINITVDEDADTSTYWVYNSFQYSESLSVNISLQEKVTLINVPFVSAAIKITYELTWPLDEISRTILLNYKEPPFIKKTIEEALFKGWKVPFLEKIKEEVGFELPLLPNNTFRLMLDQNDTAKGPFTVSRGIKNKSSFGSIVKFENKTELAYWPKGSTCNNIVGSDGTIYPSPITKMTVLRAFNSDLCRSLSVTYNENVVFDGVNAFKFTTPASLLRDPRECNETRCYCYDEDVNMCLKGGVSELGPCKQGAPVAMSYPHFLHGDPEYIEKSGSIPDSDKHSAFVVIHPRTGIVLQGSMKFQINLMLKPIRSIKSLSKIPEMVFPLMWAEECASLDANSMQQFRAALLLIWIVEFTAKWILPGITLMALTVFVARKLGCKRVAPRHEYYLTNNVVPAFTNGKVSHVPESKRSMELDENVPLSVYPQFETEPS